MKKKKLKIDPLKPSATILIKLGSIMVHTEEFLSPKSHAVDKAAIESLINDREVLEWRKAMDKLAFLPVKR